MYVIAMIAIIIGGEDLFEEPGAIELACQAVDERRVGPAARAGSAKVVALHFELSPVDPDPVYVDRETARVQARSSAPRGAVDIGAGVSDFPDAERAQLRGDDVERDGEAAIAHERCLAGA